jgi:hypothetical protein
VPDIPDTPLPASLSLAAPGGAEGDGDEIDEYGIVVAEYYIIPWAHDMSEEHFRLHVRLRHAAMMRARNSMYSRIRHEEIHRNCPPSWFNHKHKEPGENSADLAGENSADPA